MPADPALIALFVRGWAMTRHVAPPAAYHGGHYIEVGQPDQRARYVFPTLDIRTIAKLERAIAEPWVYLKICESEEAVRAILPSRWVIRRPPTYMMTSPLFPTAIDLPSDYVLALKEEDSILTATINAGAALSARGRIALLGDAVLFDQIHTEEPYRRRGLGRTLMQALSNAALDRGAPNGLLAATEMGRALYESINWTVHSPYTSAVIPA